MLTEKDIEERNSALINAANEMEDEAKKTYPKVIDIIYGKKRSGGDAIRQLAELEAKIDALKKLIRTY